MRHSLPVQERVIDLLKKDFDFDISKRITVLCDLDQFKKKEDESVWLQDKQVAPKMYEVYWDGEWIIDFADDVEPQIVYALFWQGFLRKYKAGKVFLNETIGEEHMLKDYEQEQKKQSAKDELANAFGVGGTQGEGDDDMAIAQEAADQLLREDD